ncbi:MAG TPA: choice-of-anchor D domain-containing protein [Thermoanaerobaculia bacterium]|nr:choice-of-anchor D domain-containing protein [Thermoanaerobaculia bacterium]
MLRWSLISALLALVLSVFAACQGESPTAPPPGGGGGTPPPAGATVTITVSNPNPLVSSITNVTATVTQGGAPVPNGTAVEFSTNLGTFEDSGTQTTIRTTTNGAATAVLTSATAGVATITVRVNNVTRTATVTFRDRTPDPVPPDLTLAITSITPSSGPPAGGQVVTLRGRNIREPLRVLFGNQEARVISFTETEIKVVVPPINLGTAEQAREVTVTVFGEAGTTSEQQATAPQPFRYELDILTPQITVVTPTTGPNEGNTRVTIIGSGFQSPLKVFFGAGPTVVEAQVLSVNFSQIVVMTPPATGLGAGLQNTVVPVRVLNVASNTEATLAAAFRYGPLIQVNAITPADGPITGGTRITIDGWGFDEPVAVSIGGRSAQVISVSGTQIIVIASAVPTAACADIVNQAVVVTNIEEGTSATSPFGFNFRVLPALITSITPNPVIEGGVVTIGVTNAGTGVIRLTIGGQPVVPTAVSSVGNVTNFTVPVPTTLVLNEEDCPGGGKKFVDTQFDVGFQNLSTGCANVLPLGVTITPLDTSCRLGPDAAMTIDRSNFTANVGECQDGNLTVKNIGTDPLVISSITSDKPEFTIIGVVPGTTLAPDASVTYIVRFCPTVPGVITANITLVSNDPTPPDPLIVQGATNIPDAVLTIDKTNYIADLGGTDDGILTVTNTGTGPLNLSSISISDPEFSIVTGGPNPGTLPTVIAAGDNRTYIVRYAPTDTVPDTAQITITSNDPTPPPPITIQGTTTAPDIALSISKTDYNACPGPGGVPPTDTGILTITNVGTGPLTVTAILISDTEFSVSGDFATSIAAGASRDYTITYTPTDTIADTATITIVSNDPVPPPPLTITGSADPQDTGVAITKTDYNACVGGTPDTGTLTITNIGCADLVISAITVSDLEFTVTGTIPITLAPGDFADYTVTYTPTDTVDDPATITITSNDPTPPAPIAIQGKSGVQDAGVSIGRTTYAACLGDTDTATDTLRVDNLGCAPLTVNAISSSDPEFNVPSAFPQVIPAGGFALFTVEYTPTDLVVDNATLTVVSNDPTPPPAINVTGSALVPNALLTPEKNAFAACFGETDVADITVTNTGDCDLEVTAITSNRDEFTIDTSTLPDTIAPGDSVSYEVTFTAPMTGVVNAQITFVTNDPTPPGPVALTGTALEPNALLEIAPSTVFACVGSTATTNLRITNTGTCDLEVTNLTSSHPTFTIDTSTLPDTIAAGAFLDYEITYTPTVNGTVNATITATTNDPTPPGPASVTGITDPAPNASMTISKQTYSAEIGSTDTGVLTITNTGCSTLQVNAINSTDSEFQVTGLSGTIPGTIAPGDSETYTVTYAPVDNEPDSSNLTLDSNDPTPPAAIPVTGSVPPNAVLAIDKTIYFVPVAPGTDTGTITVTNTGGGSLIVLSITDAFDPSNRFTYSGPFGVGIPPNTSLMFTVTYTAPAADVTAGVEITVNTNDPTPPPAPHFIVSGSSP